MRRRIDVSAGVRAERITAQVAVSVFPADFGSADDLDVGIPGVNDQFL
jgi:hypothetical protein